MCCIRTSRPIKCLIIKCMNNTQSLSLSVRLRIIFTKHFIITWEHLYKFNYRTLQLSLLFVLSYQRHKMVEHHILKIFLFIGSTVLLWPQNAKVPKLEDVYWGPGERPNEQDTSIKPFKISFSSQVTFV